MSLIPNVINVISGANQPAIGAAPHSSRENRITRIVSEIMAFIANLSVITNSLQFVIDNLNAKNRQTQYGALSLADTAPVIVSMPRRPTPIFLVGESNPELAAKLDVINTQKVQVKTNIRAAERQNREELSRFDRTDIDVPVRAYDLPSSINARFLQANLQNVQKEEELAAREKVELDSERLQVHEALLGVPELEALPPGLLGLIEGFIPASQDLVEASNLPLLAKIKARKHEMPIPLFVNNK